LEGADQLGVPTLGRGLVQGGLEALDPLLGGSDDGTVVVER
jgi:hypothetical protein